MLYGATTLYFVAEKEDELRTFGSSGEFRADLQASVEPFVDHNGFRPGSSCDEGNKVEMKAIVSILSQFRVRHCPTNAAVLADAGKFSQESPDAEAIAQGPDHYQRAPLHRLRLPRHRSPSTLDALKTLDVVDR